jgi:uncharacterized BrkB/YihY/UPF0761 family membrane protein
MFDWWVNQMTGENLSQGTWYNMPLVVGFIICVVVGVIGAGIAVSNHLEGQVDDAKFGARIGLGGLVIGPILVVFWPFIIPVALVLLLFWMLWRAI